MTEPRLFAEGATCLRAILSTGSREVHEVFYLKKAPSRRAPTEAQVLCELARSRGIPVTEVQASFFDEHAQGKTHGGLMAHVGERRLSPLSDLLSKKTPFLAYLSGIEDPYNFASCLRTLYAAGCDGVLLPERNWMSATSVILRASAGASERIDLATTPSDFDLVGALEGHGITPVCARETRAESLYATTLSRPLCLFVGGERRGIETALDRAISRGVRIPYGRAFDTSLSAHSACAVIAFEILRQNEENI